MIKTRFIHLDKQFNRIQARGIYFDREKIEEFISEYAKTFLLWRNAPEDPLNLQVCYEELMETKLKEIADNAEKKAIESGRGIAGKLEVTIRTPAEMFNLIRMDFPENIYETVIE